MSGHPYRRLPAAAYWRRAVAERGGDVDPIAGPFLTIAREDRVMTAGSCFAQHIGRHLAAAGLGYLVTESAHPIVPAEAARAAGYGIYTARYGNIYTALQLVQLVERAYGRFAPVEDVWQAPGGGGLVDPFRPTVQPGGFASRAELEADRTHHLARVREALETCDLFVFTLGLTETWVSAEDGAVFPLCPGVSGGVFDPARHRFHNFGVDEVSGHLESAIRLIRAVNPRVRVMLTVSPVPLAATASGAHVLAATTYSKAVLRVAAEQVTARLADVFYFPSYEIVTGPQARGRYFAEDLREVTEEGVAHVMRIFLARAAGIAAGIAAGAAAPASPASEDKTVAAARRWVGVMCDESMLDPSEPSV